jgi:V8-like Glu-specific endopeptidase
MAVRKIVKTASKPPAPLYLEEAVERIGQREAIAELKDVRLDLGVLVGSFGEPEVELELAPLKGARVEGGTTESGRGRGYELRLSIHNAALGAHVLPPPIKTREFEHHRDIREAQREYPEFEGLLPDHLPMRVMPRRLSRDLMVPRRVQAEKALSDLGERPHMATTIFAPDQRYTFNDTAFPWCTTGKIETPGGSASGAMVGPRHVLTCSHAIQWNADGTAGWVKFTPSYFDGSAPFGVAWGTMVYWEGVKVVGPTINRNEGQHDYVCVVLNTRIGDLTGWMGSRSWSDDWDGEPYWAHIGYPGDLAGGQRPSFQSGISLDGSFWDREVHTRIFHQGDVWPGQSGGPFFAWWAGESWPRVVADQSGQDSDENSASGGAHMVDCIIRARNDFP